MKKIKDDELKQLELNIFKKVIEICERHNLRYIVDYGSLIGIIRHGGFIPWDDDIDISMPRPDYEVFKQAFVKEVSPDSEYELRTGMKNRIALPYIQVVNKNTITVKKGRREAFAQSVWVDVFPIDGAGNEKKDLEQIYEKYWDYIDVSRKIIGRDKPFLNPAKQIKQFYWHYIRRHSLKQIIAEAERTMQTFDFESSGQIFCFPTIYGTKEKNAKKYYEDRIEMSFEGIPCKIPREYDEKLRGIYGDYMRFPPEEKRTGHDYTAWWK